MFVCCLGRCASLFPSVCQMCVGLVPEVCEFVFEGFQCTARYCQYILDPDYVAVWLPDMRAVWER